MSVKQLSIFVRNTVGRIADITEILAKADVDIRAMSVADTTDFGILRLIVNNCDNAVNTLRENNISYSLTDVIAITISDRVGSFSEIMRDMSNEGIQVEYMYAFISRNTEEATVVLRVDDTEKAIKVLKSKNIDILEDEDIQ